MKRGNPEHQLQAAVVDYLTWCLPPNILWTASLTGANLDMRARVKAKAAGVRRGFPDLMFVFPDGVTRYIELKTAAGSLTPEQREFRDHCAPHGIFALCRSIEDVAGTLGAWGARLKAHPFQQNQEAA